MKVYTENPEDQPIDSVDMWYRIDQKKLVQWLKHMRKLNMRLMNDLSRDKVQRGKDEGRFDVYDCLLGNIQQGTIFMKDRPKRS